MTKQLGLWERTNKKATGDPRAVYLVTGTVDMTTYRVSWHPLPRRKYALDDGDIVVTKIDGVKLAVRHPHYGFEFFDFDPLIEEKGKIWRDYNDTVSDAAWFTQ